jgi:hypothetical protein
MTHLLRTMGSVFSLTDSGPAASRKNVQRWTSGYARWRHQRTFAVGSLTTRQGGPSSDVAIQPSSRHPERWALSHVSDHSPLEATSRFSTPPPTACTITRWRCESILLRLASTAPEPTVVDREPARTRLQSTCVAGGLAAMRCVSAFWGRPTWPRSVVGPFRVGIPLSPSLGRRNAPEGG